MEKTIPVRYVAELTCESNHAQGLTFQFPAVQGKFPAPAGLGFRDLKLKQDNLTYEDLKVFMLTWFGDSFIEFTSEGKSSRFEFPFPLTEVIAGIEKGGYDNCVNQFYLAPKESRNLEFSIHLKVHAVPCGFDETTPQELLDLPTAIILQHVNDPAQQLLFNGSNRFTAFESLILGTTPEFAGTVAHVLSRPGPVKRRVGNWYIYLFDDLKPALIGSPPVVNPEIAEYQISVRKRLPDFNEISMTFQTTKRKIPDSLVTALSNHYGYTESTHRDALNRFHMRYNPLNAGVSDQVGCDKADITLGVFVHKVFVQF